MGNEHEKLELGMFNRSRARANPETFSGREKAEVATTVQALENLRQQLKETILERKRQVDEMQLKFDQRKKAVKSHELLSTADLTAILEEARKIGEQEEKLKHNLAQAWNQLYYNHPQLSENIIVKIPNGSKIAEFTDKIKSPDNIKKNFSDPLKLFLEIEAALTILRSITYSK